MILEEATAAMKELHALTTGMKQGSPPDAMTILGIQSDLVNFYREIGEDMARKFGTKERSYLERKISQAQQYQKARLELKMTGGDSSEASLLAVGDEFNKEIESAVEYERYRTFMKAIQNAIDSSRQTVSFLSKAEFHPS